MCGKRALMITGQQISVHVSVKQRTPRHLWIKHRARIIGREWHTRVSICSHCYRIDGTKEKCNDFLQSFGLSFH